MEAVGKQLLYYGGYQPSSKQWKGSPILNYRCINVNTGEEVCLCTCFYHQQAATDLGGYFYQHITHAAEDFDILWDISPTDITPVAKPFEEVEAEYLRMLLEGFPPAEINSSIMESCQSKKQGRSYSGRH